RQGDSPSGQAEHPRGFGLGTHVGRGRTASLGTTNRVRVRASHTGTPHQPVLFVPGVERARTASLSLLGLRFRGAVPSRTGAVSTAVPGAEASAVHGLGHAESVPH